ncbi:hypothetical protein A9Q84_14020 [Halobacteriovorax marinus]|uniref:Exonuclease domain-containing protein n=1 Tax=Halobacteriovorax marinus TaxID=97084 RepID=A0A1Y5F967_9BACT|nr:hypothetical protein A9Q84_14020 [Halobacteriovorax marinus]
MREQYNILDFETTGLSADYDRVIEVGVVKIRDGKIIDTFEALINPGTRISSTITSLTGITNNMVKDALSAREVMPELKKFLGDDLIFAHNASFDSRFFKAEMMRAGLSSSNLFLCSLLLARRVYQQLHSHKLGVLCQHVGFTNQASHRALGDAEATFYVLDDILKKVKSSSGKNELSADYLAKLSKVPKKKVNVWLSAN